MNNEQLLHNVTVTADRLQATGTLRREEVPVLEEIINELRIKLARLEELEILNNDKQA